VPSLLVVSSFYPERGRQNSEDRRFSAFNDGNGDARSFDTPFAFRAWRHPHIFDPQWIDQGGRLTAFR